MSARVETIDRSRPLYGWLPKSSDELVGGFRYVDLPSPTASVSPAVRFAKLADQWKRETSHLSLMTQRIRHPAYQQILKMSRSDVVPLILEDLKKDPEHWFHALMLITGENPIPADFSGTVNEAIQYWIEWGEQSLAT